MDATQQTGVGLEWLIYLMFGLHPDPQDYTTMNQRLEIQQNLQPTAAEISKLGVLVAGNRGHGCAPGTGGVSKTTRNLHAGTDTSLFNPLPFVLRPVDDDLTLDEQKMYCLRRRESHDNQQYFAYYGLRFNITRDALAISKKLVTKVEGEPDQEQPWVPDNDNLYPEPVEVPNQGAVTAANTIIIVNGQMRVELSRTAIANFVEAIKILYDGDEEYAIMSEFGLCCGVDRNVTVPGQSGNITFKESIATKIYTFTNDHKTVYMNTQSLDLDFDVGNSTPLFTAQAIPTLSTVP